MIKKFFMLLLLLLLFIKTNNYAQENSSFYPEPNRIKLLNPDKVNFSVEKTFDAEEFTKFCKGKVSVKCYLDSSGLVSEIRILVSEFNFSELNQELFKLNLRKYLRFEVPIEIRDNSRKEDRYFILATNPKMFNRKLK